MPELPEVEVVRQGLERHVAGRTIGAVQVLHPRAVRRHVAGPADFASAVAGLTVTGAHRRGKYLWLPLAHPGPAGEQSPAETALVAHLGMSGQMLVGPADRPFGPHVRVHFAFADHGPDLRFTDQRTFGHLLLAGFATAPSAEPGGVPEAVAHIARDPMDPAFDEAAVIARLRKRHTSIKAALLDQSLISGVGNIYADEALWRSRLHGARLAASLTRPQSIQLLVAVREVLAEALAAGGTSFDRLYVDVNGASGYFGRSLAVYGREGEPCLRCGAPIRRDPFANRSSYTCPMCQPRPRGLGGARDLRRRST
ncbi:MAG TPA: bifunctional DNA-formamidopyrimidine glycosylase/DNA-(apurinic or apyrimidinic site) lyase [Streptosporangiaceae bacterium]|nr:bifunctional DNA-formamidopyrimidine glycosylase/DNA-(apurinic or apyrimidinic site) lyase [Streptosporangiaceae bacterium]